MPLNATDPLYILYTSGTTGIPKGVVRDNGGHMVALKWTMWHHYGIRPGEVFWAASDVGWVVGHSYIVYAPLLHGATTVLFEGKPVGTPDPGTFWRVIAEHKVAALFTAPTAFRAIRKEDPEAKHLARYSLTGFRALFLAGERADPDTVQWAERVLHVPVLDHWWQTETGWVMVGNPMGLGLLPVKHGSPTVPMPGFAVSVVDEAGQPAETGKMGSVVVKLPLPPGALPTLWRQDRRMQESYLSAYPGFYNTSDGGLCGQPRLHLHHGPHGRHHQCRGPPPLHRRHGGGACLPPRCRRMRGDRHPRRIERRAALRFHRPQIRRKPPCL